MTANFDPSIVKTAFDHCKTAILDDISAGFVPKTIKSFDEIHYYVDGNQYFVDAIDANSLDWDDFIGICNAVQDILDDWIRGGF